MATRVGVLAPLAHRDFRLLAIGHLTSLAGDGFFRVAIAIQVLVVSNAAGAVAATAMAWGGGMVAALPLGGWVSDRFPRRRVMMLADAWRGLMIGGIGVLSVTGQLELWHLISLGAGFGLGSGFFNPAAMALVPDLVPAEDLARANSFLGVARPAMVYIVGPILGGLLVTAAGPGAAFLLDAASFGVSIALLAAIAAGRSAVSTGQAGPLRDIVEGVGYVLRTRWAWPWLLGAGVGTLAFHGPFDVLVPYLLFNEFGLDEGGVSRQMAYILAAGGAGSIVAGTALGQWQLPRRFMTTLYVGEAIGVAALVAFGLMWAPWHAVIAGGVLFTLFAVTDIIWTTTMQRLVPREMLGRVASLDWFTSMSLAPVSFGVAWALDAMLGARAALVVAGLSGALVLLALLAVPGAREPERAEAVAEV